MVTRIDKVKDLQMGYGIKAGANTVQKFPLFHISLELAFYPAIFLVCYEKHSDSLHHKYLSIALKEVCMCVCVVCVCVCVCVLCIWC